jgi:hypothetical protein
MTVLAGTIRASSTGNPDWKNCDGSTVYVAENKVSGTVVLPRAAPAPGFGDHRDWRRRVGTKYGWVGLGVNGFRFRLPVAGDGNYVKTNDDTADT